LAAKNAARKTLLAAALLLATFPPTALAQAPAGPISPPPSPVTPPKPAVRVSVDLVSTPVTVRDRKGDLVLDLAQKDFRVLEDGVEQKIEHFDLGGDPISIVVLIENSDRVAPLFPAVRGTGILFSQAVMPGPVEAAVVTYDDTASLRLDFTRDADAVQKTIQQLPLGLSGAALYDALSKGVTLLSRRPRDRRRVILALAEAADTGSESKLGEVLRAAELQNVTIYSVGLSTTAAELRAGPRGPTSPYPPGINPMPGRPGTPQTPSTQAAENSSADLMALAVWVVQHAAHTVKDHALEVAAKATGGEHYPALKDRAIETGLSQIAAELHAQYTLAYRSTSGNSPGFHSIRVEASRPALKIRARPGYYLD
jgi:VWFA-related protein